MVKIRYNIVRDLSHSSPGEIQLKTFKIWNWICSKLNWWTKLEFYDLIRILCNINFIYMDIHHFEQPSSIPMHTSVLLFLNLVSERLLFLVMWKNIIHFVISFRLHHKWWHERQKRKNSRRIEGKIECMHAFDRFVSVRRIWFSFFSLFLECSL